MYEITVRSVIDYGALHFTSKDKLITGILGLHV